MCATSGPALETPYPEIDVARLSTRSTFTRTHLDTWLGRKSPAGPPAGGRADAGGPKTEDDGAAHAFDAKHL